MEFISNETFDLERSLYHKSDLTLKNVKFEGVNDGESVLKECTNINVDSSLFNLRYPLWHNHILNINNCKFLENSRAPIWYSSNVNVYNTNFNVIKAFRECKNIKINDSNINSDEVFWKVNQIEVNNSSIEGVYAFFECKNLALKNRASIEPDSS